MDGNTEDPAENKLIINNAEKTHPEYKIVLKKINEVPGYIKITVITTLFLILITVILLSVSFIKPDGLLSAECSIVENEDKFDCYPDQTPNKEGCEKRGCCWQPLNSTENNDTPLNVPYCFYPLKYDKGGYRFTSIHFYDTGMEALLQLNGPSAFVKDEQQLKMIVTFETKDTVHVQITDVPERRFTPRFPEVPRGRRAKTNLLYNVTIFDYGFKVIRVSDNTVIFDTTVVNNMVFSDQFLQITSKLPTHFIYGLGHHQADLLLSTNWTRYTMFNHDSAPDFNKNLYGSHPFYLAMEESSLSHGVFLLNSNAMDVILQPKPAVTFRTIGGVLDFYYFLGPTPQDVIRQYLEVVGRPAMPPFWALGFHLCRFGYKTLNNTKEILFNNINAGIPVDVQWNDIDYMERNNDFTYDKVNFEGLPEFVNELHEKGMHYILMVDPGISASEPNGTYPPYDDGVQLDVFIKNSSDQIFVGKVWNKGNTVWPDFTNPQTTLYWTKLLKKFNRIINFDGVWIDMNDPSNFLNGALDVGCVSNKLEYPQYTPAVDNGFLNYKTLCMSAKHYDGLHYDLHNLYGFYEAIATHTALAEIRANKRPVLISRSTFSGQGKFSSHWSGDVHSTWEDMKYSIPQLINFNMFGLPFTGADICGFNGNTTTELCMRWSELGAFYPFARNHNTDDGIPQDPASMGGDVLMLAKNALQSRYSLLPYLYTLFYRATRGGTVVRPLFFEFPNDRNTYDIQTQFLWGPALMIIPILTEDAEGIEAYVPKGLWYNYYSMSSFKSKGEKLEFFSANIQLLLRGGYIIPTQSPNMTTTLTKKNRITLYVATDESGYALGEIYWDDGDFLYSVEDNLYTLISLKMRDGYLTSMCVHQQGEMIPNLGSVKFLGVKEPTYVRVNNDNIFTFTYDTTNKVLTVFDLDVSFNHEFTIWINR